MINKNINGAATEARRFLKKVGEYNEACVFGLVRKEDIDIGCGNKYSGAIKRASMDLTRALAKMRQET